MDSNLRVILLEDVNPGAETVEHVLVRAGLDCVLCRARGQEELRQELEHSRPDLVLIDQGGPGVPESYSLEAMSLVQAARPGVPCVFLLRPTAKDFSWTCLRAGAEDFVFKPDLEQLPLVIQKALAKAQAQRQLQESEVALTRNEEQFRQIAENSRDLVCLLDLDFQFLYASPSFFSILGRPPAGLVATACLELVHPDDVRAFREALDETLFFREGRHVEMRFRHASGGWLEFESAVSVIWDGAGRPQQALVASRDTSERKRAEKEIRKLAAFPRFNPNPVLEFAADGALTYFNDAALEMARSLKRNHPQSILPLNTATIVKLCLSTGQSKLHHGTNNNGRILSWSFFPVMSHQLVHCYAEDVTERLNLEAQLRQVQKMDSVGQLAAGVAHDFNNILTIIQGHAGLLNSESELPAEAGESVRQIAVAAERAANLTRQLLMFSRKQILQPQLLNLNAVVQDVSKLVRALIGENVTLRRQTAEELAPIYADPGMMEQVLVNLSVNARDAMSRGGTLTISTFFVEIDAGYVQRHPEAREGNFICLSVSDTGHGMDASTLTHIFEPFFTTKEIGKGTGLGLATVYGIVSQHQGWIEVESQVGQGTTFKVFLPQATKAALKRVNERPKEIPGGDETILVVEDETALRELVQEILQKKGYRVFEASTGVQALEIWNHHKEDIDLLLTDMMMPEGVSGRELAERVLRDRADLKVIYSSGYGLDVCGMGPDLQDANFLQKPYDPETLALMVRACLNN